MARSYAWIILAYAVAVVAAGITLRLLPLEDPLWMALVGDVVATVVVFGFSFGLKNSSTYDPYWSVAPLPIVLFWIQAGAGFTGRNVLALGLVCIWGIRLTANWIQRWRGLGDEDWRYVDLQRKHGRAYWAVSLSGIHLFPTLLVFLGLLPVWAATRSAEPMGWIDGLATFVVILAIAIEARSDAELRTFLRSDPGPRAFLATGLWKYSRHPNYFGEVLFWWGLFGFGVAASSAYWWTAAGAVSMTLLFRYISIPMMDERMMARRDGYREYADRTSGLMPRPPR